jgi:hypothetical protein
MEVRRHVQALGPTGLCFLTILLLRLVWAQRATTPLAQSPRQFGMRPVRGPSEAALREARFWRLKAMQRVSAEFEGLEAWDPALEGGPRDPAEWRVMMAKDLDGALRHAYERVVRAQQLARTRDDKLQAGLLSCRIQCERGDHEGELREARRLAALAPRHELVLIVLERAATCSGHEPLARRTRSALRALRQEEVHWWTQPGCEMLPDRSLNLE